MASQNDIDQVNYALDHGGNANDWAGSSGNPWISNIVKGYKDIFGRPPTVSELEAATASFAAGGRGESYIAQQYEQEQNSPAKVYERQQKEWQGKAPQYNDQVQNLFKATYGREANADELSHYGTLLASGQADPYQLSQFLQSLPEYQNAQDKQFRSGLDTELQKSDENFFNRAKGGIAQQYALMGRPTSPALDVALTDLASQLSDKRQTYLAQLSASQYGGNKSAALGAYSNTQNDVMNRINQNWQTQVGDVAGRNKRNQDLNDYMIQAQQWAKYADNGGPGWMDYLNTGLNVANTATNVGSAIATGGASMAAPRRTG